MRLMRLIRRRRRLLIMWTRRRGSERGMNDMEQSMLVHRILDSKARREAQLQSRMNQGVLLMSCHRSSQARLPHVSRSQVLLGRANTVLRVVGLQGPLHLRIRLVTVKLGMWVNILHLSYWLHMRRNYLISKMDWKEIRLFCSISYQLVMSTGSWFPYRRIPKQEISRLKTHKASKHYS